MKQPPKRIRVHDMPDGEWGICHNELHHLSHGKADVFDYILLSEHEEEIAELKKTIEGFLSLPTNKVDWVHVVEGRKDGHPYPEWLLELAIRAEEIEIGKAGGSVSAFSKMGVKKK